MAGIYLHIPFCKQACTYCNFHFSTSLKNKEALTNALISEINTANSFIDLLEPIDSVYFGGGTPSLLNETELTGIFDALRSKFNIRSQAEITLEANPDDITSNHIAFWKKIGVNRLSVGLQSFVPHELQWMNRAHTSKQSEDCIHELLHAQMANISTDLIFGIPDQTDESILDHLHRLEAWGIPHISCYALTVESKTALHHQIKQKLINDVDSEQQARQFLLIHDTLTTLGYEHYEISNYALPGHRSGHNSSYWQGNAYWGFGPSAHAYDGKNTRRWNIANNTAYIKGIQENKPVITCETLTFVQQINEFVMIRLRMMDGISLTEFDSKFGVPFRNQLMQLAETHIQAGRLLKKNNQLRLSREGMLYADGIAADLFM